MNKEHYKFRTWYKTGLENDEFSMIILTDDTYIEYRPGSGIRGPLSSFRGFSICDRSNLS